MKKKKEIEEISIVPEELANTIVYKAEMNEINLPASAEGMVDYLIHVFLHHPESNNPGEIKLSTKLKFNDYDDEIGNEFIEGVHNRNILYSLAIDFGLLRVEGDGGNEARYWTIDMNALTNTLQCYNKPLEEDEPNGQCVVGFPEWDEKIERENAKAEKKEKAKKKVKKGSQKDVEKPHLWGFKHKQNFGIGSDGKIDMNTAEKYLEDHPSTVSDVREHILQKGYRSKGIDCRLLTVEVFLGNAGLALCVIDEMIHGKFNKDSAGYKNLHKKIKGINKKAKPDYYLQKRLPEDVLDYLKGKILQDEMEKLDKQVISGDEIDPCDSMAFV